MLQMIYDIVSNSISLETKNTVALTHPMGSLGTDGSVTISSLSYRLDDCIIDVLQR